MPSSVYVDASSARAGCAARMAWDNMRHLTIQNEIISSFSDAGLQARVRPNGTERRAL
jgi:hypothetical protein